MSRCQTPPRKCNDFRAEDARLSRRGGCRPPRRRARAGSSAAGRRRRGPAAARAAARRCRARRRPRPRPPRGHPLRQERADDPRQDVAGAGRGERRRPVQRDEDAFARARRRACRPLQHADAAVRLRARRTAASRCATPTGRRSPSSRAELALVRRQHRRRAPLDRLEPPQPSASTTTGSSSAASSPRTSARVPSLRPRPGPSATASARSASSSSTGSASADTRPVVVLGQRPLDRLEQPRLEHRQRRSGRRDGDVARVGAERRSTARHAAPVRPREPPTTSTEPARYFVASRPSAARGRRPDAARGRARGRRARARSARRRPRRRGSGRARRRPRPSPPPSSPSPSPARRRPAPRPSTRRRRKARRPRRPAAPEALIALDRARRVVARRAAEARAEERVDDDVGPAELAADLDLRQLAPADRSTRAATRPSPPFEPRPQTTATRPGKRSITMRATASRHAPSARSSTPGSRGAPARAASISAAVTSGSGRSVIRHDDRDRRRQLARVRHRQLDPARADPLRRRRRPPRQPHARLRPPGDLDLLPREVDADADRLADRLLAGEPRRVVLRRVRLRVAVRALGLGEAALAEARVPLERPPDPLDLDQVDADAQAMSERRIEPRGQLCDRADDRVRAHARPRDVVGTELPVRTSTVRMPLSRRRRCPPRCRRRPSRRAPGRRRAPRARRRSTAGSASRAPSRRPRPRTRARRRTRPSRAAAPRAVCHQRLRCRRSRSAPIFSSWNARSRLRYEKTRPASSPSSQPPISTASAFIPTSCISSNSSTTPASSARARACPRARAAAARGVVCSSSSSSSKPAPRSSSASARACGGVSFVTKRSRWPSRRSWATRRDRARDRLPRDRAARRRCRAELRPWPASLFGSRDRSRSRLGDRAALLALERARRPARAEVGDAGRGRLRRRGLGGAVGGAEAASDGEGGAGAARGRAGRAQPARNRELAVERLVEQLRRALQVERPRRPTAPTRACGRARLEDKRRRATVKRLRGGPTTSARAAASTSSGACRACR